MLLREYLWRQRTKFEATIAFSMLEPWEKILSSKYSFHTDHVLHDASRVSGSSLHKISYEKSAVLIFTFLALLLASGVYRYLPQHVSIMHQRATYYLWGQDGDDRLLRHFVDPSTLKEL
ncbi:hypothetical protein V8E55_003813 [Tylopilus felleus]